MIARPMLAAKVDSLTQLRYPLLLTPKIDGIRCLVVNGRAVSRSFKLIRNEHIRTLVETLPEGTDGELVVRDAEFSESTSGIMSCDGKPDFVYKVFDRYVPGETYKSRVLQLPRAPFVEHVYPFLADDEAGYLRYEEACLTQGYEGVVGRHPSSPYKFGRSTLREGYMLKIKRVQDSDAYILGFKESNANINEIVSDAWGYATRPGGAAGKVPKGTLGAFLAKDVHTGVEFSIGGGKGLTLALRQKIWDNQAAYLGKIVKYEYQAHGVKDRPRFPRFAGFRDSDDI